jgi:competence protein ComGF
VDGEVINILFLVFQAVDSRLAYIEIHTFLSRDGSSYFGTQPAKNWQCFSHYKTVYKIRVNG